jgi:histidyl-tRNA synthetase
MWEEYLTNNIQIVKKLRNNWINTELYLDSETKIQKQLKYADNKKIPYVIIAWEDELKKWIIQLKDLVKWKQKEIKLSDVVKNLV